MIKKFFLPVAVLLVSMTVYSQDIDTKRPNYKKIEKEISKEKSDYFYPKLFKKFMVSDSTMTLKEKRYLYYGYTFQNRYSPYGSPTFNDSINEVFKKKKLEKKDFFKIFKFGDSVLVEKPFDLKTLYYQIYAYDQLGDKTEFKKKINQFRIIVDAILSSGDGLTKETAFYVIYISHEYDLLGILGFEFGGEQRLIEHYDYLKLAKNPQKIKGFYFDVTPCLNSLQKTFK